MSTRRRVAYELFLALLLPRFRLGVAVPCRTGRVFACEHFDLEPDMLCVAAVLQHEQTGRDKAMSGGLAPIGAMIATAPIATSMEENDGAFYSTYGWHPRSVAGAIAALRDLKANLRPQVAMSWIADK